MSERREGRGGRPAEADELGSGRRELRYLDPETATFHRSPGGILRLTLPDRSYRRVKVHRVLPLSQLEAYLSVRVDDSSRHGGEEIGIVRHLHQLPTEQRTLVRDELERRYFRPVISRVNSVRVRSGEYVWSVLTDRGPTQFTTQSPTRSSVRLDDGRWILTDVENNRYEVGNLQAMDERSRNTLRELLA